MSKHKNRKSLREVLRDFFGFLDEDWQAGIETEDTDDEPNCARDVPEHHI